MNVRVVKLKLSVAGESKEEINERWARIRQIMDDSWKAANWIVSGQFLNEQFMQRIYDRKGIDSKNDPDAVSEVEDDIFSRTGFFGVKRQATTEKDIKSKFPLLPSCVTNPLNQVVFSSFKADKKDRNFGNSSVRTYKRGMPVTVAKKMVTFENDSLVNWKLSRSEVIQLKIYYGKDRANNRLTIQRILDGQGGYDYSAPQIQLKDKKLFLLLPVQEPESNNDLDPNICVGVDLGINTPAYVALQDGPQRKAIGSKDDFLKTRMQMQNRKRRIQRSSSKAYSGKGRKRKLKAFDHIKEKERNFAHSYNHFVSREAINFALKNRAGVIKLELLAGYGDDLKGKRKKGVDKNDDSDTNSKKFILRNWSYYQLQEMIEYKAKREGIRVVMVDPYRTSKTCSVCGHYEEGQRHGEEFECAKCGEKRNADFNAAVNIAKSDKIVTNKEDCEYYKKYGVAKKVEKLLLADNEDESKSAEVA